jgi:hypothetical protein
MAYRVVCVGCGRGRTLDVTHVKGMPVDKWWESRGRLCKTCREAKSHPYANGLVPRVAGSDTSADAADSQEPQLVTKQMTVLGLLRDAPDGLTDDELEEKTGWRHQTVSARRRELVLSGRVRDTGARRMTSSGRQATVWGAVP